MAKYKGLSSTEAEKRLRRDGENTLASAKKANPLAIFGGQFKDAMVLILLAATVVSVVMGEIANALTIVVVVILNAALGFIQEYRTEKTLEALKKFAAPTAQVYRDGKLTGIPSEKLVRGDIIELEAGSRVPADCKILDTITLECDESMLTGESLPVAKKAGEPINNTNALNQPEVCYMGTIAVKGHACAEIIETGKATQMGKISGMLSEIEQERTPLQNRLGELGKIIGITCIIICVFVSLVGILRGYAVFDMLFTGISLAVAAIPEGLPATVTISLALAIRRIYKQKALVNKLHSVETLGCTDVICTDKTGTLTQNKMTVTDIFINNKQHKFGDIPNCMEAELLFTCGTVCNNAIRQIDGSFAGDPTETALRVSAEKRGIKGDAYIRTDETPFDSMTRFMSVKVLGHNSESIEFIKGSPDVILDKCAFIMHENEIVPLSAAHKKAATGGAGKMAEQALRLLGFAYKPNKQSGFIFIGLQGMSDPLRPEVRSSVRKCERAGIRVIMLTGDHKNTAAEIAKQAGILKDKTTVITGAELIAMSDGELQNKIGQISVFARVSPQDKLRIVRALKNSGKTVAMTGDGVNDAPAVKEAAIGVAMGITGTDVTKEAAQIVLLDDNFATLVSAVEQGRTIYNNIRKFVRYMLSCNIGEVITMFAAMFLGMPVVLVPIQILLINLVTDGLPAIALSTEPPTDNIMNTPPRAAGESIFSGGMFAQIITRGFIIGICTLLTFILVNGNEGIDAARTAAMVTLGLSQLIFVFECKDNEKGIFNADYGNNKNLILAVFASTAILCAAMYSGVIGMIFQTVSLGGKSLLIVLAFSAGLPILRGIFKALR